MKLILLSLFLTVSLIAQQSPSAVGFGGNVAKKIADSGTIGTGVTIGSNTTTTTVLGRLLLLSADGDSMIFEPGAKRAIEYLRTDGQSIMYVDSSQQAAFGSSSINEAYEYHAPSSTNIVWIGHSAYDRGILRVKTTTTQANFLGEGNAVSIGTTGSLNPLNFTIWNGGAIGVKTDSSSHDIFVGNSPTYSYMDAGSGWTTVSSIDAKENLSRISIPNILSRFANVKVYQYNYKGQEKKQIGVIAEHYGRIHGRKNDKTINSKELAMTMWMVLQEQQEEINNLKAAIKKLKKRISK